MTILLFVVVLVVLILVHEFGHFVVAKLCRMRVDEFGIGYPPRIWGKKFGETVYSINALPFGGFVRIYGEDATDADVLASHRSFAARPRAAQALTLIAGVAMNLLLAYILITATLVMGTPRALSDEEIPRATDLHLAVAVVLPGSPAAMAGIIPGDIILSAEGPAGAFSSAKPDDFISYIAADSSSAPLTLTIERNGEPRTLQPLRLRASSAKDPSRVGLGVSVAPVGIVPEPLLRAPIDGAIFTWRSRRRRPSASWTSSRMRSRCARTSRKSLGPRRHRGRGGQCVPQGLAALLSISAIISINLAIINLLPVPALDGGRLLFVIIEAVIRRPIKPS